MGDKRSWRRQVSKAVWESKRIMEKVTGVPDRTEDAPEVNHVKRDI